MTLNERLHDAEIRRKVRVLKYADGLHRRITPAFNDTHDAVERELALLTNRIYGTALADPTTREHIRQYRQAIKDIRAPAWDMAREVLRDELPRLARDETDNLHDLYAGLLPLLASEIDTPPRSELRAAITNTPIDQAGTLTEALATGQANDTNRIVRRSSNAMTQAENASAVPALVLGTAALAFRGGVLRRALQGLEGLIDTGATMVQTETRRRFIQANQFMVERERFTATLDSRTTKICARTDGKVYKVGEGPEPPLHWRCRSIRVAYLTRSLAERGFDPSTERTLLKAYAERHGLGTITSRDQLPRGHKGAFDGFARTRRRALIGTLPDDVNFEQFLRRQSVDFQNEYLGTARARRFRRGDVRLDRFIRPNGTLYTLSELQSKGVLD